MDVFNNREIAILFWAGVLAVWVLSKSGVWESFKNLLKAFCNWKICLPTSLLAAYVAVVAFSLSALGLWDMGQLKNTVVWTTFAGFATMCRIGTNGENPHLLRKWITDNLKVTVVVEFVVALPTFPLLVEIVFVPVVTVLVVVHAYAETREEHGQVVTFLSWVLSFIGLGLIAFALYVIATDFNAFATVQTGKDFYTPPLLSLLTIPFFFALYVVISYENAFTRLEIMKLEPPLRSYAKWRAMLMFRHRVDLLTRWLRDARPVSLPDKVAVRESMRQVWELWRRERNPPTVDPADGWSPYDAIKFLEGEGLGTGDYHGSMGDWFAGSPFLEIGGGVFKDNIAYYVEGRERAATRLKLIMNVNNPDDPSQCEAKFRELAVVLASVGVLGEGVANVVAGLFEQDEAEAMIGDKRIKLSRNDWERGYTRRFEIEHLFGNADLVTSLG